jgi:cyclopropane-fatty-acyl-phospholipid synthase
MLMLSNTALFIAVVCVGAFEHFCSEEEYNDGRQNEIYEQFFNFCANSLKAGGKLYLQTMTWGKKVPVSREIRLDAPEGTPERILARIRKFYPGSWPPSSKDQIVKIADKRFLFIKSNNGKIDYIETLNRWGQARDGIYQFPKILRTISAILKLVPRYFLNSNFRIQLDSLRHNDQQVCFENEIMTHERMFFEKR